MKNKILFGVKTGNFVFIPNPASQEIVTSYDIDNNNKSTISIQIGNTKYGKATHHNNNLIMSENGIINLIKIEALDGINYFKAKINGEEVEVGTENNKTTILESTKTIGIPVKISGFYCNENNIQAIQFDVVTENKETKEENKFGFKFGGQGGTHHIPKSFDSLSFFAHGSEVVGIRTEHSAVYTPMQDMQPPRLIVQATKENFGTTDEQNQFLVKTSFNPNLNYITRLQSKIVIQNSSGFNMNKFIINDNEPTLLTYFETLVNSQKCVSGNNDHEDLSNFEKIVSLDTGMNLYLTGINSSQYIDSLEFSN